MAEVIQLERKFKLGAMLLDDPDPDRSPEDALAMYEPAYPMIKHCRLGVPDTEGDYLVYPVERPSATTKGAL